MLATLVHEVSQYHQMSDHVVVIVDLKVVVDQTEVQVAHHVVLVVLYHLDMGTVKAEAHNIINQKVCSTSQCEHETKLFYLKTK